MDQRVEQPQVVAGRVDWRPYCKPCFAIAKTMRGGFPISIEGEELLEQPGLFDKVDTV
jgi:hypothetical protein